MKLPPNRLEAGEPPHPFAGREIDRGRPLSFRLNGHEIKGFAGDTVLSAALASGVIAAGRNRGAPLSLDADFSPIAVPVAQIGDLSRALPIDRLPARHGADLVSFGTKAAEAAPRGVLARLKRWLGPARTLGHDLDQLSGLLLPYVDMPSAERFETDTLVVGAGLAGLGAALAAAQAGERVILVEKRASPGGDARLFGTAEGDEKPDEIIRRVSAELAAMDNVGVLFRTEVFALFDGIANAHQIAPDENGGDAAGRVIDIAAKRVVLACGAGERLPVVPGNRLPGVIGLRNAFQAADRYGVWRSGPTVIVTSVNAGYRLAVEARKAEAPIAKIIDSRREPASRFAEFAKAWGIRQSAGFVPQQIRQGRGKEASLVAELTAKFDNNFERAERAEAEQIVLCGGWQPQLTLWHMSGGTSRWNPASGRLEADGAPEGVALAGAAAGYRNSAACLHSGAEAVAKLLGHPVVVVEDLQFAPIYESLDGPLPVADPSPEAGAPAFLDGGTSLTVRPPAPRSGEPSWALAEQTRALSLGDVATGVLLGAVPAKDAGTILSERCVIAGDFVGVASPAPAALPPRARDPRHLPVWLEGRFGDAPELWVVAAPDGRRFETGCLIHANTDGTRPEQAIGVVLRPHAEGHVGALALLRTGASVGDIIAVRDMGRSIPARVVEPYVHERPAVPEAAAAAKPAPETQRARPKPARRAGEIFTDMSPPAPTVGEAEAPIMVAVPARPASRAAGPARSAGAYYDDRRKTPRRLPARPASDSIASPH
jgi:sarcosine oxidase subunit alpha